MRLISLILLCCTLLCTAGTAAALQVDQDVVQAGAVSEFTGPQYETYQRGPSLSEAVERIRRQTGGQIVSAQTIVRGGREVHVIKVLMKGGTVKTFNVPGRG